MTVLRIICLLASMALVYVSLMVYQDEQQQLKSRLENLWIHLSDLSQGAYRGEAQIVQRIQIAFFAILDFVLGKRLLSVRAFAVSVLVSTITGIQFLVLAMSVSDLVFLRGATGRMGWKVDLRILLFSVLAVLLWSAAVYLCRYRWFALVICLVGPLVIALAISTLTAYNPKLNKFAYHISSHRTQVALAGAYLGVWISVFSDVGATSFLRSLTYLREMRFRWLVVPIASLGTLIAIAVSPYLVYAAQQKIHGTGLPALFGTAAAVAITYLNADIFIFAGVVLAMAIMLACNHAIWPPMLRGLYLIHDSGLLANRRTLFVLGMTLGLGSIFSPDLILPIVKRELGIPDAPKSGTRLDSSGSSLSDAPKPDSQSQKSEALTEQEKAERRQAENKKLLEPWLSLYIASSAHHFDDLKGLSQGAGGHRTWSVIRHPVFAQCQINEQPESIACTLLMYKNCSETEAGYAAYSSSIRELVPSTWRREKEAPYPSEYASNRTVSPEGLVVTEWIHRDTTTNSCQLMGAVTSAPEGNAGRKLMKGKRGP